MNTAELVLNKRVDSKILVLRNQKVILDTDLAELYGVPVKQLNQQVKRNEHHANFVAVDQQGKLVASIIGGHQAN